MQATTELKRGTFGTSSLGTGDKCPPPPCFRFSFGKVQQQCSILHDQTTGDLNFHHLHAGVTALFVPPPPPFLSAVHEKKFFVVFKGTFCLFGGHVPLRPPPPWVLHRGDSNENPQHTILRRFVKTISITIKYRPMRTLSLLLNCRVAAQCNSLGVVLVLKCLPSAQQDSHQTLRTPRLI